MRTIILLSLGIASCFGVNAPSPVEQEQTFLQQGIAVGDGAVSAEAGRRRRRRGNWGPIFTPRPTLPPRAYLHRRRKFTTPKPTWRPTPLPTPSPTPPPTVVGIAVPVANVDNNAAQGETGMQGLSMLGGFFNFIASFCVPPYSSSMHMEVCEKIPQFGLVWHQPGDATNDSNPACNPIGCQCKEFPLDPANKFFWFGVWVPPNTPIWSGGGVCLVLRTNSGGNGITPGTGAVKLETSLLDVLANFLPQGYKQTLEAALAIVTAVGVGFSIDRSLLLDLDGQPELLINARRRDTEEGVDSGVNPNPNPLPREYFWACKDHAAWAFPSAVSSDPYCSTLKGHIWMSVSIDLGNILQKKPGTKNVASVNKPEADEPLKISDLFSFALDITIMFSADAPSDLVADVTNSLSPALAFTLFRLLLEIQFSIMCVGSVTMTVGFAQVSGGLFSDWTINMAALLLYFRKGGSGAAFYLTYSRGEAANDMGTLEGPPPNTPAAAKAAEDVYKDFETDNIKDALKGNEVNLVAGLVPTGVQFQIYAIITGCSGTFPDVRCDISTMTGIGFGVKIAIITANGGGFAAFIEKPIEDPKEGKPDTLYFCISNLEETEKSCLNLGFLLWLLRCLAVLADIMMAVGRAFLEAFEEVGKFMEKVGEFVGKVVEVIGDTIELVVDTAVQAIADCFPNNWIRRRHWCNDYPRRRNLPMNEWCWGNAWKGNCGGYSENGFGDTPAGHCRLMGIHPMCLSDAEKVAQIQAQVVSAFHQFNSANAAAYARYLAFKNR